jgi:hypothetical protein
VSELELELRELGIDWPETPDLAARVEQRLAAPPERPRRSLLARPAWQLAVAATALVIAVAMAIPPARAAVLDWLGFSSVRITREEPNPSTFGQALVIGEPVTLEQARRAFPLLVPEELGEPDAVYLYEHPTMGPRVDLMYRARDELPTSSNTGVGLLVTQFRAVSEPLIEKTVGTGARVEKLTVGGDPAFFISGAPHGFAYFDPESQEANFEEQRLAGNTLLVDRSDGVLLRIEAEITRDRAVEIAESVR